MPSSTHPAFAAGEVHTGFLDEHPCTDPARRRLSASPPPPWHSPSKRPTGAAARVLGDVPSGWRNNPAVDQVVDLAHGEHSVQVSYRLGRGGHLSVGGEPARRHRRRPPIPSVSSWRSTACAAGTPSGETASTRFVDADDGHVTFRLLPRHPDPTTELAAGSLAAPMPGTVLRVLVAAGDVVAAGQPLVVVEAMKMEHQINAPADGVVADVLVGAGRAGRHRAGAPRTWKSDS